MDDSAVSFFTGLLELCIALATFTGFSWKMLKKFIDGNMEPIKEVNQKVLLALEQHKQDLKEATSKIDSHDKDIEGLTKNVRRLEEAVQLLSGEVSKLQGQLELIVKTIIRGKDDDA